MPNRIKVVVIGLGPIGIETCKLVLQKKSLHLVAAVDIDPKKNKRDLSTTIKSKRHLEIPVFENLELALKKFHVDVAILTSKSKLPDIQEDIFLCIQNRVSVISSCEELLFPFIKYKELSAEVDKLAKENFVHILGTGVNPGFIMDIAPLFFSSVCSDVKSLRINRVVDLNKRRKPLQVKMGLGKSKSDFNALVRKKKLGHVGLLESAQLIADGLRFNVTSYKEKITPILAREEFYTKYFDIKKGSVCGMTHSVSASYGKQKIIELNLQMRADISNSYDLIKINGNPKVIVNIEKGIFGDTATVAMLVNCIPNLLSSNSGLLTMKDIPVPGFLNPLL